MMMVQKANGEKELFRLQKLRRSLKRAGASAREINDITAVIESEVYDGITTEVIYRRAFDILRSFPHPLAARYSLRRALFDLGPTGFPFEDYLAQLMQADGYRTKTGLTLRGACVSHEIDVLAWKSDDFVVMEAKFHGQPGTKSDVQVALYTHARFLDLKNGASPSAQQSKINRSAIVTNTKFTTAAIRYASCVGIDLISWGYPKGRSLEEWIERTKLYPITVLSTLEPKDKTALIREGAILCKHIIDNRPLLSSAGISRAKIQAVMDEGSHLCVL